jgi:uncharacterized phage infection (PIP) family protein YhgE
MHRLAFHSTRPDRFEIFQRRPTKTVGESFRHALLFCAARLTRSPTPGGRALMSTAGKVLVVLVTLTTLVWMILASGVGQLNRNGNNRLHELNVQLAKAQDDLKQTQNDIVAFRDETSSIQEKVDRDIILLEARLADVQKVRSQIIDGLERLKYQLATVTEAIKGAQTALEHRNTERQAEEKALADTKAEVQSLMAESSQLANRLSDLRQTFRTTYKANVEMVGKSH